MIIKDTKPVIDQLTKDAEITLNLWLGCGNEKGQEIYRKRYKDMIGNTRRKKRPMKVSFEPETSTVGATMLWLEHGLRAERGLTENGTLTAGRPGNLRSRTEVALASVLKKLTV